MLLSPERPCHFPEVMTGSFQQTMDGGSGGQAGRDALPAWGLVSAEEAPGDIRAKPELPQASPPH